MDTCHAPRRTPPDVVRQIAADVEAMIDRMDVEPLEKAIRREAARTARDLETIPVACFHCAEDHSSALTCAQLATAAAARELVTSPAKPLVQAVAGGVHGAVAMLDVLVKHFRIAWLKIVYDPDPEIDRLSRAGYTIWQAEREAAGATKN